jgi:hypothetical protein
MRCNLKYILALGSLSLLQGCVSEVVSVIYYVGTADQRRVTVAMSQYSDSVVLSEPDKAIAFFDENAELSVQGQQTIVGKANILAHLKSLGPNKVLAYDFKETSITLHHEGFVQSGTYRQIVVTVEGAATTVEGTFEAEWVNPPARGWLMRRLQTSPTVVAN